MLTFLNSRKHYGVQPNNLLSIRLSYDDYVIDLQRNYTQRVQYNESSFFTFNPIIFFAIFISIYTFLRDKKKGQLEWKEYKRYHTFAILTNKRWIQKDLNVIDIKDTDDIAKNVEHYKDIVFVSLDSIKLIEILEHKELGKWKYFISLYFSYNKKKPKNGSLGAYISSKSPNQIIFQTLKTLPTIKHEEINRINKNKKIYQFYY